MNKNLRMARTTAQGDVARASEIDEATCPWTSADECSTVAERSVAGVSNVIPGCEQHGRHASRDYTITFRVAAPTVDDLPEPRDLLFGIQDGLPDDWYVSEGDDCYITGAWVHSDCADPGAPGGPAMTHAQALVDTAEIAALLGDQRRTVSAYRSRGEMPPPLRSYARAPAWEWGTVRPWIEKVTGAAAGPLPRQGNHRRPRSTDDLVTAAEAAALCNMKPLSFLRNTADDRDGPKPDWRFGGQGAGGSTPVWHRATIIAWRERRPGKGWRAGA